VASGADDDTSSITIADATSHRGTIVVTVDESDYVSDIPRGTLVGRSRGNLSPQPICTPHERSASALREQ
jgi:hypothetical protein